MAKRKAKTGLPAQQIEFVPKTEIPIPNDLPVVVKGNKVEKEAAIQIALFVCDLYATNVYPLVSCLQFAGIRSDSTWLRWVREVEEVKALYADAKRRRAKAYVLDLHERSIDSLQRQISGEVVDMMDVTETIEFVENEQGEIVEKITARTIKKKQTYVRPSSTATMFALINIDFENFKKAPEPKTERVAIDPISEMSEEQLEAEIKKMSKRINAGNE